MSDRRSREHGGMRGAVFALAVVVLAVAAVLALWSQHAFAATVTWDGGGADDSWGTPENWSPDGVPSPSDDVVIDGNVLVEHDQGSHAVHSLDVRGRPGRGSFPHQAVGPRDRRRVVRQRAWRG